MYTGEKTVEVREDGDWIRSRLFDKKGNAREYDYFLGINGYGQHRPMFVTPYEGFGTGYDTEYIFGINKPSEIPFAPVKHKLKVNPEHFILMLGDVLWRKELQTLKK